MAFASPVPGVRWLTNHWEAHTAEYRLQWVASDGERLLAHGSDLDDLLPDLEGAVDWSALALAYVDGQDMEASEGPRA